MNKVIRKIIESLNPWHFVWIVVLLSLFSTLLVTVPLSYLWWGNIRIDIVRFCAVVGVIASFVVSIIILYFVLYIRREKEYSQKLTREIIERQAAETTYRDVQDQLEQRVDERTAELARTNHELKVKIVEAGRLEVKLRASEAQYRAIVEDQTEMICRYHPDGNLSFVNEAFCRYFDQNREELLGTNFFSYIPHDERDAITEKVSLLNRNIPQITIEHQMNLPDGVVGWNIWTNRVVFDDRGWISHYQGVGRDITVQKKIEDELLQAHKMEAIGTLAAGVAHDFNNILNSIFGHIELILRSTSAGTPVYSGIIEISKACKRAADLVKQILTFSRRSVQKRKLVYLQPLIEEVITLQQNTMVANIDLQQDIDPACGPVIADPTQVHAVIMNLTTNACQAMSDMEAGQLLIGLQEEDISIDWTIDHDALEPGRYVKLTVRDTGHGMDEKVLTQIFDPYFTTKAGEQGTGLGLAIIRGIVASHQGTIVAESKVDSGTHFDVYLPLAEQTRSTAKEEKNRAAMIGGAQHILYVDDEKNAVQIWGLALRQAGFNVTGCTGGAKALALFSEAPDYYDLIITDQRMPDMLGLELAREINKIRPQKPILLTTGWNDEVDDDEAEKCGVREIISKPHEMDDLLRAIEIATA